MNSHPPRQRPETEPDRVRRRTASEINRRIDASIEKNIRYYAAQPREVISRRIRELDREWDIERTLQTNAASLSLIGLSFAITGHRKWMGLPFVVLSFLLMHGIQGWCPPVPVFRRAGVRTRGEIDREKFALQFLRGDFDHIKLGRGDPDRTGRLVAALQEQPAR